jgi:adenylate cyclase
MPSTRAEAKPVPQGEAQLAILFADVSGSTQLYDTLGDARARSIIARCIDVMTEVTHRYGGTLVKTIGDGVMTTFPSANEAADAACAMQDSMSGRVVVDGRPIAIRIGFHFGSALIEDTDVFGDAVNLPSRIASEAKAGQILTTGATVAYLSGRSREFCRQIDLAQIRGKQQRIPIYEVVWSPEEATLMRAPAAAERRGGGRLVFTAGGSLFELGEAYPTLTIGRAEQNDLVLRNPLVSRLHARIEYRNGRFVLTDQSANGTYVAADDGSNTYVRRDNHVLMGSGALGIGETVTLASDLRVRYEHG